MLKRNLFFWIDRLQILPAERVTITVLFAALVVISSTRLVWQPAFAYDQAFYHPIEEEFNRLSAMRNQDEATLLARYYPAADSGTKDQKGALVSIDVMPEGQVSQTMRDSVLAEPGSVKININSASLDELTRLPGIGPIIAERIVVYREEHGAFETIDELLNVRGIGPVRLEQIKPLLTM